MIIDCKKDRETEGRSEVAKWRRNIDNYMTTVWQRSKAER